MYDVGAHVGYFTLIASRIIGTSGKVYAFEPLSMNLAYLHRHRRANRLENVTILPVAVGRVEETRSFQSACGSGRGRLVLDRGGRSVRVVALDELWKRGEIPPPNLIKMDIEGFEGDALRGAAEILARFRPTILLSTHGDAAKEDCEAYLGRLGYRFSYFKQSTIIASPPEASLADHRQSAA
jgi:FkbM family methyltransferase